VTVLVAWVVFPMVVLAIALGNGLLVQRISGAPLPGSLILPGGVAAMIVLAQVPVVV
jgi:hypothetical protein